jgi:Putative Flp pilus-assembly TadE/G-like
VRQLMTIFASRITRLRRDERGAIGIIVGVLLGAGVLTGMGAMVVDVGQLYQERAELQNGAAAAALAVAKTCALGDCDSSIAVQYADANASALTGHTAGVPQVCGSAPGLSACPQGGGGPTACPPPSTQTYLDVFTATKTSSGSHLLPPVFAQTLLGNSSYNGTQVQACAQATWGPPTTGTTAGFTISACEWDQATQLGTVFGPVDQVLKPKAGQNPTGCASEPGGADGPGTFGWLNHVRGNCTVPVSPPSMAGRTRPSVSYSCELLLQNAYQTQTALLVPTYVSVSGSTFSLQGLSYFVVTGYNLPGQPGQPNFQAWDSLDPGNNCQGNDYCVNGYFVRGTVGSSAGLNGTDQGVYVLQLTG